MDVHHLGFGRSHAVARRLTGRPAIRFSSTSPRRDPTAGYTALELMLAAVILLLVVAAGAPALVGAKHDIQAGGAVTYLAAVMRQARIEAARRHVSVAVRVAPDAAGAWEFQLFVDGDGDGVHTDDIEAGIDPPKDRAIGLAQLYPGVDFRILPGVRPVVPGETLADGDPVRLGRANLMSCTPLGGCSGGSVYLAGPGRRQMVVRVLGGTGRVRSGRYAWERGTWVIR